MKTVHINVDWNNLDSIEEAEKAKLNLENKGYTLINSFGGLNHSVLIYLLYTNYQQPHKGNMK